MKRLRHLLGIAVVLLIGICAGCVGRKRDANQLLPALAPAPGVFFVAPDGDDNNSGRTPSGKSHTVDGPFATIPRAIEAAREFKHTSGRAATICLRGGRYELREPIVLRPEDSQLNFIAYGDEKPVLSGGRRIVGWKKTTVAGRTLWVADVPEARNGWRFRELWVNGQRAVRARNPNRGYFAVAEVPDAKPEQPWHQGQSRFGWKAGDMPHLEHPEDAEILVMTRWVESRLPLAKMDDAARLFMFGKRSTYKLDPGDLWYAEGAMEFLDAPGEWFLDSRAGKLLYVPKPGESLSDLDVVAPRLSHLLELDGAPESGLFVEGVILRGITFSHCEWQFPSDAKTAQAAPMTWPAPVNEIGGFGQAAVGVPGAVRGNGLRGGRFLDCEFVHLGSYGLELTRGCQSNLVSHCVFADLAAGGIKIGETVIRTDAASQTLANEISDCEIRNGGKMFHSAVGIWIGQSPNNSISHCLIEDFYYTGISIGWTWGYGPALATNNLVERNEISHIGVRLDGDGPILSDMGGIYTLGMQPGTRIVNNLWHDIAGLRYGGWGIYLDEGSSSIIAETNIVYRTTHGGFHQHYGATNIIRNNIFAFARDHQLQRTRDEPHVSFSFSNNIVLFDHGVLLGGTWANDRFVTDANVYWDARMASNPQVMQFAGTTLDQWRSRGHDTNSVVADPLFQFDSRDDFRLRADSPALRLGFKPIDLRGIGPRKNRQ